MTCYNEESYKILNAYISWYLTREKASKIEEKNFSSSSPTHVTSHDGNRVIYHGNVFTRHVAKLIEVSTAVNSANDTLFHRIGSISPLLTQLCVGVRRESLVRNFQDPKDRPSQACEGE